MAGPPDVCRAKPRSGGVKAAGRRCAGQGRLACRSPVRIGPAAAPGRLCLEPARGLRRRVPAGRCLSGYERAKSRASLARLGVPRPDAGLKMWPGVPV